ncbi:MAG TPA: heme lyase CcmF/NrfE family subunit [Acidimicrobiia bacterium]
MLAFLGSAGVVSALAGAIVLVVRGIRVARGGSSDLVAPGRLVLSGAVIAMAAMELALLSDDFSLAYVANHHATTTPFPFDVATAWAALEGSIILWGLVLAVFIWATTLKYRNSPDRLGAAALAVMGGVAIFFFGLMVTVSNPFEVCVEALSTGCAASSPWPLAAADVPANGPGPNALLQNHFLMAIHPPVLYVGYVGLTVPFAYAIGALSLGVPGPEWLKRSHRSTLVAWSFLTLGIILGGWWAYEVLSWGGYWAWDPVENASLLPWLVATAFIHSGLVQQRRGMLQAWNFVLVISAFALTILGTFLTRSGTINSVHSFTQSAIGPALLGFMVLVLVGSFTLFSMRSHLVATSPRIQSFVSREGSFLVNNLLLAVYAFVVLIGTTYPLLLEAFTGTQVGVGEPFFNRLAVPLSFLLLLTMGFGPVTPWRGAAPGLLWRRLRGPTIIALAAGIVTALVVTRVGWVVLAVTLGLFVSSAILGLLLELARSRTEKSGRPLPTEIRTVLGNDQSFWAGQLSHVGVVLVAVGIAFAANLPAHLQVELAPGDSVDFAGYTLVYDSPFRRNEPNRVVQGARIDVLKEDRRLTTLEPRLNLYQAMATAVITPAVMTQAEGDLYLTLRRIDADTIDLDLDTSPMIWLIWLGGLTTAAGGFWSLAVRRTERAAERDRVVAHV